LPRDWLSLPLQPAPAASLTLRGFSYLDPNLDDSKINPEIKVDDEGNALFGQWTYSGKGMKPKEHRASKGNYSVAAYKWPFDSVRSYMKNLNTHRAYQDLRDKRVELRRQGKEVSGLALAETLVSYSEKGQEYVKTLKSIITTNDLEVADKTYLREEPVSLIIGIDKLEDIEKTENTIDELRASGELDRIIGEMRLGLGE
jgi:Bax protein